MQERLLNLIDRIIANLNWSNLIAAVIGYVVISLATYAGTRAHRWLAHRIRQWRLARTHPIQSSLTNISLTLLDKDGKRLRYCKGNSFIFTRPTQSYVEYLWSEGRIENVFSSAGTVTQERLDSGHQNYRIDFPSTHERGAQEDIVFSADFLDSFSGTREWWTHDVMYHTDKLLFRILPPAERPIASFSVQKWEVNHWQPQRGRGRLVREGEVTVAQVLISHLEIGDRYKFEWTW